MPLVRVVRAVVSPLVAKAVAWGPGPLAVLAAVVSSTSLTQNLKLALVPAAHVRPRLRFLGLSHCSWGS